MRKTIVLIAILLFVIALSVTPASAQTSATSGAVTIKAIVPEFIGLTAVQVSPVVFDFTGYQDRIAAGDKNVLWAMVDQGALPRWNMNYNLRNKTVTVCAYASDLMGNGDMIKAEILVGQSLNMGSAYQNFIKGTVCSNGNAILLDQIKGATSSMNTNHGQPILEGFKLLQLNTNADGAHVPTPDTYTGSLFIVAQTI